MAQEYKIIQKLAAGGFAEVFLGSAEGVEGFSKTVAIKRILPNLTKNTEEKERFVRMFLDEARLWAQLNHNKIVQVFDLGAGIDKNNDSFFIVMEYVDGANLEIVMRAARKLNIKIPYHHAVFITMQILEGLFYAHTRNDENNQPLNIVHRDISPPNIILTVDGHVKITDFGLAKATTQLERTSPNSLKGKIDYMSPEQAKGEKVDHRTDLFATAILLHEMLSNKKLYSNKATLETLGVVQKAHIEPIRKLNPEVHPELEEILTKALDPIPSRRYQTALEFEDALACYLFKHNLKVITHDLSKSMQMALSFKKEEDEKKSKVASTDTIDQLIMNALVKIKSIKSEEDIDKFLSNDLMSGIFDVDKPLAVFSEEDEKKNMISELPSGNEKIQKGNTGFVIAIIILVMALLAAVFVLIAILKK